MKYLGVTLTKEGTTQIKSDNRINDCRNMTNCLNFFLCEKILKNNQKD